MKATDDPRPILYIGSTSHEVKTVRGAVEHFTDPMLRDRDSEAGPIRPVAVPGGETTDSHWVKAQLDKFQEISALRCIRKGNFGETESYFGIPFYMTRGDQEADVDEINLLFEERARNEFPIMQQVCQERGLDGQRFQVGINTIDLLVFGLKFGAGKQLRPFVERTRRETQAIWELTDGNAFFLIETPSLAILSNLTRGKEEVLRWYAHTLEQVIRALPQGASWGFHFCDGRLGGNAVGDHGIFRLLGASKLIYKPKYTVRMSNYLLQYLERRGLTPELAHYPLALGSRAPSLDLRYYNPYRHLYIPQGMQIFAGAVSDKLTLDEHVILYKWLDIVFRQLVGMTTTCGFGSSDLGSMLYCLEIKGRLAYV